MAAAVALALLVGLTVFARAKRRGKSKFGRELSGLVGKNALDPGSRLSNLEARLETIISLNVHIKERLEGLENRLAAMQDRQELVEMKNDILKIHEKIYRAFDRGKKIDDLAQEFGRTRGEIELILNLRRMKE